MDYSQIYDAMRSLEDEQKRAALSREIENVLVFTVKRGCVKAASLLPWILIFFREVSLLPWACWIGNC